MKTIRMSVLTTLMMAVPMVVYSADPAPDMSKDICNESISKEEVAKIRESYQNHKACAYNNGKLTPQELVKKRGEIQKKYNAMISANPSQQNALISQMKADLENLNKSWDTLSDQSKELFKKDYEHFEKVFKAFEDRRKFLCAEKKKIAQGLGVSSGTFDVNRVEAHGSAVDAKKQCEYFGKTENLLKNGRGALNSYKDKLAKAYHDNAKMLRQLKSNAQKVVNAYDGQGSWCYAKSGIIGQGIRAGHLNDEIDSVYADKEGVFHKLNDRIFGAELPRIQEREKSINEMQAKVDTAKQRCVSVADEDKDKALSADAWAKEDERNKNFATPEAVDSATAQKYKKFYEESSIGNAVKAATSNKDDGRRLQAAVNDTYRQMYQQNPDAQPYLRQDGIVGKRTITAVNQLYTDPAAKQIFINNLVAQGFSIDAARALASDPN